MIDPKNLPAPLEAIATEFGTAVTMRMAQAEAADAPNDTLFHYTNETSLNEIIATNLFWFTSIYHMDDPDELSYGNRVCRSIFKTAYDAGNKFVRMFCEPFLAESFDSELI